MRENKSRKAGDEVLEKVRNAIRSMNKFKRDNRLCGGVWVFVGEDVLNDLLAGGGLARDPYGNYSLGGYEVKLAKDYPIGYIAAE